MVDYSETWTANSCLPHNHCCRKIKCHQLSRAVKKTPHSIITCCAACRRLTSLQTYESITHTNFPGWCFIVIPETSRPHQSGTSLLRQREADIFFIFWLRWKSRDCFSSVVWRCCALFDFSFCRKAVWWDESGSVWNKGAVFCTGTGGGLPKSALLAVSGHSSKLLQIPWANSRKNSRD